jgi:hypothetical protein
MVAHGPLCTISTPESVLKNMIDASEPLMSITFELALPLVMAEKAPVLETIPRVFSGASRMTRSGSGMKSSPTPTHRCTFVSDVTAYTETAMRSTLVVAVLSVIAKSVRNE